MTGTPNRLQQFAGLTISIGQLQMRWVALAKWTGIMALLYLIGPVIFIAASIQQKASAQIWQAEIHWQSVRKSAFPSLFWYIPLFLFHSSLAELWARLYSTLATLLHLPFIALLGGTSLWPPLASSLLLHWLLGLPLASLLACLLEAIQPLTVSEPRRIVSPSEQQELAARTVAREKRKSKTAQSSTHSATDANKARTASQTKPEAGIPVQQAARPTLWEQVDWNQVPDNDPLKQVVIREALADKRRQQVNAPLPAPQMPMSSPVVSPTTTTQAYAATSLKIPFLTAAPAKGTTSPRASVAR